MSKLNHTGESRNIELAHGACTGCGVAARPGYGYALRASAWPAGRHVYACIACKERADTDGRFRLQFERCAHGGVCLADVERGFAQAGFATVPTTREELLAALESEWALAALMTHPPIVSTPPARTH